MPIGPVPLRQTAQLLDDLRAAVIEAYATFGASSDVPEVRIHHGLQAPFDCDGVAWVLNRGLTPAPIVGADPAANCMVIADQLLAVELARCWPVPDAGGRIDPDAEARASGRLAEDATILWYGLGAAWRERTLFPSYPTMECEMVRLGVMSPVSPGGGFAGWSWPITARIGLAYLDELGVSTA